VKARIAFMATIAAAFAGHWMARLGMSDGGII
jgi:hypothetical protein